MCTFVMHIVWGRGYNPNEVLAVTDRYMYSRIIQFLEYETNKTTTSMVNNLNVTIPCNFLI